MNGKPAALTAVGIRGGQGRWRGWIGGGLSHEGVIEEGAENGEGGGGVGGGGGGRGLQGGEGG